MVITRFPTPTSYTVTARINFRGYNGKLEIQKNEITLIRVETFFVFKNPINYIFLLFSLHKAFLYKDKGELNNRGLKINFLNKIINLEISILYLLISFRHFKFFLKDLDID